MLRTLVFTKSDYATLLIALALGYIVLYLAKREEGVLKTTGRIIATIVIVISLFLLVTKLITRINVVVSQARINTTL